MLPALQQRPSYINIDLDALEYNFFTIQSHVFPAQVMPIIKSNAYGHGMIQCGKHLEKIGAKWLGVALLEEGIALRQAGVRIPIVVLGGILHRQIDLFITYDLDINAASIAKLEAINNQARCMKKRARVHLEIDTGLERTGIHYFNAHKLIECASRAKWCDIIGMFSHFATGEDRDLTFAKTQLQRFQECQKQIQSYCHLQPRLHMAASGAIMQLKESHFDIVRPGLLLYGIVSADHLQGILPLKPVLSLTSRVVYFKVVKEGVGVSYDLKWKAPCDTRIVTIPVGYGDGFNRQFMHGAHVLIRGKRYPIVGRICMDQFMVDIGQDEVYNDEEVVIIGQQGSELITVESLARLVPDGNAREITCLLSERMPRRYYEKSNPHCSIS